MKGDAGTSAFVPLQSEKGRKGGGGGKESEKKRGVEREQYLQRHGKEQNPENK